MTPAPRLSRLWFVTGPVLVVLVVAVVAFAIRPIPYVVFSPGGARAVEPLVTITPKEGGPAIDEEPPTDDLLYVTVSSVFEPSGIVTLWRWLDDLAQVEPSAPFLGTQTRDENRALNAEMMTDSQDKARKVALERLGYEVTSTPIGAFLEDVDPDYPAATELRPGMTIVGADGAPIRDVDELLVAIQAHRPGETMVLEVVPLGEREAREVTVELGRREGEPERAALGVQPTDRVTYEFPVDIAIDVGKVGGPSAGLAFTLAILDRMTPGSLTGDDRVAVTGTIELDGRVGPVGGVRHKAEAAIREGAELFLVPPEEFDEATDAVDGRIAVASVASLDEALVELEAHGGDPLEVPGR